MELLANLTVCPTSPLHCSCISLLARYFTFYQKLLFFFFFFFKYNCEHLHIFSNIVLFWDVTLINSPSAAQFLSIFFLAIYTSVTLFISSGPPFFASDTIRRNPPFLLSNLQVPFTLSSFKNHHLFHVNPSTHPCILFLSLPSFLGTLFFFISHLFDLIPFLCPLVPWPLSSLSAPSFCTTLFHLIPFLNVLFFTAHSSRPLWLRPRYD